MTFIKRLFIHGLLLIIVVQGRGQTLEPLNDSLMIFRDTITADSIIVDTLPVSRKKSKVEVVDSKVDYKATDTMIFDLSNKKIFLYKEAQVIYKDIQLDAGYIVFDMGNDEVYAVGLEDTAGVVQGKPAFKDGSETFDAQSLSYNFKTKKGLIRHAISPQEGGFLHAGLTKKHEDGTIHVKDGKYTTCDLEHPHFYLALTRAKVIPDDKIVSGPAYMVLEDVPLYPIFIPFGFFPNTKKSSAGLLIPSYGEEKVRGFYLRNGGWYMPINEYMDMRFTTDVYSKGSWGIRQGTRYVKRYKYSGSFDGTFFKNVYNDKGLPDYYEVTDYSIRWNHRQDQKANPTTTFSANVNMSSTSYDRNNSYSTSDYLTNTKNSSISYSKNWPGTPFFFDMGMNYSQNSQTDKVDMILPSGSFRMNRIYPFKSKKAVGKPKWYENVQLSYTSEFKNEISTYDSVLFTDYTLENMRNGYRHRVPLQTNFKVLKFCNISPQISYEGVIYGSRITKKKYDSQYLDPETGDLVGRVYWDTIPGFNYAHAVKTSISFGVDPTIYGMYQVKNPDAKIIATRHVMKPSARFSYTPDMDKLGLIPKELYYKTYAYKDSPVDTSFKYKEHSIYENYIYGTPLGAKQSGSLSLSLRNNVEMKIRTPEDTTETEKKIKILETFDFTTSYNPFLDDDVPKWSNLNFTARNSFFDGRFNIQFRGVIDHYKIDEEYDPIPKAPWQDFHLSRATVTFGTSFRSKAGEETPVSEDLGVEEDVFDDLYMYGGYVAFDVPWDLRINYNYSYSKARKEDAEKKISQTVDFSGKLNLTPKWEISFRSGYDIEAKDFTFTSFNITRDLHCWVMRISVVPFGYRQNYNFMINVVSPILRDLKYEKRQDFRDREDF